MVHRLPYHRPFIRTEHTMTNTDPVEITILMNTQRLLVERLEGIAVLADTMAKQCGYGGLVAGIRHGLETIVAQARG